MEIKLADFTISENESALTQTNMAMTPSEKIILRDHHYRCYYSSIKTLLCNEWLYATGNFYVDYILKWCQLQYTEWHCIMKMNPIPYFHHFSVVTNMLCVIFLLNKNNHRNWLWGKWGMASGSLRTGSSKNQACVMAPHRRGMAQGLPREEERNDYPTRLQASALRIRS